MRKILTFFLAFAASVGTMFAWDYERVEIDGLYYNLDASAKTAEVTSQIATYPYWETILTTVNIPSAVKFDDVTYTVTSIGQRAFEDCESLTTVTLQDGITSIGDQAFDQCKVLASINIPDGVTSIGDYAFSNCSSLPVENNLRYAGPYLVGVVGYAPSYTIREGTKWIGGDAFANCSSLTSITIPSSVTSIGACAFYNSGLTSLTIPNTVTSLGGGEPCPWCENLTAFIVAEDHPNLCVVDGVLFNKDTTTLIQYPAGREGDYIVPKTVTRIAVGAFRGCPKLTSVVIPESVENMGTWAITESAAVKFITCYAATPPACRIYAFETLDKSIPVYVPKNCKQAYADADEWKDFTNIIEMAPAGRAEDVLGGKFTINADGDQVNFSKGNLQASTFDLGAKWTWGFAENQWECIGNNAANNAINDSASVSANGTVDLFGWSTAATYFGIHNSRYADTYLGDFVDWGDNIPGGWRTLSKDEWEYILDTRTGDKASTVAGTPDARFVKANVNSIKGLILFPDGGTFALSEFTSIAAPNAEDVDFTTTCTAEQWKALETKGCVFLPAAGYRGSKMENFGSAYYWSSIPDQNQEEAYGLVCTKYGSSLTGMFRGNGLSVRLVKDVRKPATKSMTPGMVFLSWIEAESKWAATVYDDPSNPVFVFTVAYKGNKTDIPTTIKITFDQEDPNSMYVESGNEDNFSGLTKSVDLTIVHDGKGLRTKEVGGSTVLYSLAKISGELIGVNGDKLIVNAPSDFIDIRFDGIDIPSAIDNTAVDAKAVKRFVNGQLIIEKNGKTYNALGVEVR